MTRQPLPEFPRPIVVDHLNVGEARFEITAEADELAALAERFELVSLDALRAEITLFRAAGSPVVRMNAHFVADVVQSCVVTLEPVSGHLDARFSRLYAPPVEEEEKRREVEVPPDGEDPPEPFVDGTIDIGEAVAEQLSLELPPFPRAPGVEFDGFSCGPDADEESDSDGNPFSALSTLKDRR